MTRVIGEEKRAMVTLTARHLPIYLSMSPFISFQQSPGYGEKATSKGRYIPPNGIGARASPKASFNTVSAITMIGRLSGRIVGKVKTKLSSHLSTWASARTWTSSKDS